MKMLIWYHQKQFFKTHKDKIFKPRSLQKEKNNNNHHKCDLKFAKYGITPNETNP